jgi:hypothetical protein
VNLWNANCDSMKPVTKRELLRELKVWEDTLGRQVERPASNLGFMAKDFDRDRHAKSQKDNFADLIKQARERAKAKAQLLEEKRPEESDTAVSGSVAELQIRDDEMINGSTKPEDEHRTGLEGPTERLLAGHLANGHSADTAVDISSPQVVPQPDSELATASHPTSRFFV